MNKAQQRHLVSRLLGCGVLVTPKLLSLVDRLTPDQTNQLLQKIGSGEIKDEEDVAVLLEPPQEEVKQVAVEPIEEGEGPRIHIKYNYTKPGEKRSVQDFVQMFNKRYNALASMLKNRQELSGLLSVRRIKGNKERQSVAFIGMIISQGLSKNGHIILDVEDPTGKTTVLVNKNNELYDQVKECVPDEVLGFVGTTSDDGSLVFCDQVIWPDVPLVHELKKSPDDTYAVFISDIHVGSHNFLHDEFNRFLDWLNGQVGNEEQQTIAAKVKYLFIIGDLIDGVGIYPGQEKDLSHSSAKEQYAECARLLARVPKHIEIIACAGNHDTGRLAEPQLTFYEDFAKELHELPNITFVSNPSVVTIHESETFPGFNVLMYHGYSFDYYANNVDAIRTNGGYERADLIMKYLLQRRHLAPFHSSTLYVPDPEHDPLVISEVPDFFVTGHIHYSIAASYRNVTLISCSCWQSMTDFQEKLGHNPQPARVPLVNLKTRQVKIMRFG